MLISCGSGMPHWIAETNHAISPDGKAVIYESNLGGNRISATTWVKSTISSGGGGIFDIITNDTNGLKITWVSESKALIEYPADSKIIRQEFSTYFLGRTITIDYKTRN